MKKLLCIISHPPYQDSHSLELIESAMVGAVFDFQVSLLFRDEGVWGLLDGQDAGALQQRTFAKVLSALPTYEVDAVYVCASAMDEHKLGVEQFALPVRPVSFAEQAQLIAGQDAVLGAQA